MKYAIIMLWHDRGRFLPGVLAVTLSMLLIVLQSGLLWGLFSLTSVPVDHSRADLWVGYPEVMSVDLGRPIPERWITRVIATPEVEGAEIYLQGIVVLDLPGRKSELATVIGTRLGDDSLGAVREMTPELRTKLSEPGSVAVDEQEMKRVGFRGIGDNGEVGGQRIRLVGVIPGGHLKSLATPYLFCSIETARMLFKAVAADRTIFILGRCKSPEAAAEAARKINEKYKDMRAFTNSELSARTRLHWLQTARAGVATAWTAALGLFVGLVITSQTLYSVTVSAQREYAVLEALGISRWHMAGMVVGQAFWVGISGIGLALPAAFGLGELAGAFGLKVMLLPSLLLSASGLTLGMALLSGLGALRSLRLIEPAQLLR